ncbi:MAG: glycosyltransferase [Cyanobacteria bacterium P01_C01_bin.72]
MIDTIAYLAPEIPSVSGTFVYQEIIALQQEGLKIVPISVHQPPVLVKDKEVVKLGEITTYLYQYSLFSTLLLSMGLLLKKPQKYMAILLTVLSDISHLGMGKLKAWKLLYQFLYASRVAAVMKANNCQYLHIHFAHVPTQIGMYAAMLTGIPFSFTAHANDLFANQLLLSEKVSRAKTAVTISEYNRQFLIDQGLEAARIEVVRCGIDTAKHSYLPLKSRATPVKIGSLGRLVEKKGMDDLILALSQLAQKGIDFQLEIAGGGGLEGDLKSMAIAEKLESKIKFIGVIPHEQVYEWMKGLDLFVLACKQDAQGDRDGIPVVLMEAMTIGIPVVSTRISGISELIEHESSGFLANPSDPNSLAAMIEQFLQQSDLSAMTQAARQRVVEEFELTTNVRRLRAIFNT